MMKTFPIIGCLLLAGAFSGCQKPKTPASDYHPLQYRVTGNAPQAVIKYLLPPDESPYYRRPGADRYEVRTVSVPFTSQTFSFPLGARAFLQASNTGPTGYVEVEIVVDKNVDSLWGHASTTNAHGITKAEGTIGLK